MENEEILSKIGLNKYESRVYISLIENGSMTIAGLSKYSGINRPAIYKTLPKLQKQGLVSASPHGKQKKYNAESPNKLKALVDDLKDALLLRLPNLESLYEGKANRPVVKYYDGHEGITQVYMDLINSLERKATYYRYTANTDLEKIKKYYPKNYKQLRDRKELESVIINSSGASKQGKQNAHRVIKTMPPEFDLFNYDVSMLIYGDKIAFIDFSTETAIIIENKKIAEFQKKLFKFIYQKL